ncbi:hypothetical protein PP641_gp036 [Arthrobacter phage SilentRX]|uniref:Uncharacterized protein n=1 Tax=Arthrobacter phage SilentRX TaxID=2836091 RepID=A0A8F3IL54_9CAUD|nr:hypothetical protein PP641_gp036 [Arthrobacter phage SilentRX]QWY82776.1 hypothetical protein SEA_SILENTRX_36 [Arthrobacter phage SilentRX]
MADSDLLKMGRVIGYEPFVTRVRAAVLQYASTYNLGGTTETEPKNFAIYILKNPMFEERSMTALVAADPTVLAQVQIVDGVADTTALTDAAIKAVVSARWNLVAAKYPVGVTIPTAG